MISICIPVYNFNITPLVSELELQMKQCELDVELVVIDDGSKEVFKTKNKVSLKKHTYIELPENIGRSRIRNLFKRYVNNKYLLFLDCDSRVVTSSFLNNYIDFLKPKTVVYGGRTYPEKAPSKEQNLSWNYGKYTESKTASLRRKEPYLSFMTNNFLIDIEVFNRISFNETINTYGHEDTLFGYELFQNKIEIIHIENPVLNFDIESNGRFLKKTEQAIENLIKITNTYTNSSFFEHVRLLCFYKKRNKLELKIILLLFRVSKKQLKHQLLKGNDSKFLFVFYKLGYFITAKKS